MQTMMSHLEIWHNVPPHEHPITFFGNPPPQPKNPWPLFKRPIETWFALIAPIKGHPEVLSALATASRKVSTPSESVLRAAWDSALLPPTKDDEEIKHDDRYEFLDEDLRVADTMISHAEFAFAKNKPPVLLEGNILLATNAKPIPFPVDSPLVEEGGAIMVRSAATREEAIGEIGGLVHSPFYAQLRTPPETRTWLSTGYYYKTGAPIEPPPPPPVRGNFVEQRKELLAGKATAMGADVHMH